MTRPYPANRPVYRPKVLAYAEEMGAIPFTQADVCAALGMTPAAVSSAISRLLKDGLIRGVGVAERIHVKGSLKTLYLLAEYAHLYNADLPPEWTQAERARLQKQVKRTQLQQQAERARLQQKKRGPVVRVIRFDLPRKTEKTIASSGNFAWMRPAGAAC